MKKSVKFAVTAAAVVLTVGVIAIAMFLQSGAELGGPAGGFQPAGTGEPLRICIDLGFHKNGHSSPVGSIENGAKFLARQVASHTDGLEAEDIELEIVPAGGAERETALTRIRTEIMSGEGPDVFLCSCLDVDINLKEDEEAETTLFPFPERAMEEGLFLPLDKYLEKAEWMEWDKMLPNVTAAGKTEKGQMILPISYTMRMTAYEAGEAELYPADTTFADVVASDDPILRSTTAYTYRYDHRQEIAFQYLFSDLADYQTGELTFTEEDLYQMILDAETLYKENWSGLLSDDLPTPDLPAHFSEKLNLDTYSNQYFVVDPEREGYKFITYDIMLRLQDPRRGIFDSTEQVMLPLYNIDGGATALVSSFGAVNANTRQPDNAFAVLDYLLSQYMHNECELYAFLCRNAMPVHMEMGEVRDLIEYGEGKKNPYNVKSTWAFDSKAFSAYREAREQIAYARFSTELDQELATLVADYSGDFAEHGEDALRARISESYAKMQRLLDES